MADYYLSEKYKRLIDRAISQRPGYGGGNGGESGGQRQIIHVRITSQFEPEIEGECPPNLYYGVPGAFKPLDGQWEEYGDDDTVCIVFTPAEKPLVIGERYLCVRYGIDGDGAYVFVPDERGDGDEYQAGCHVEVAPKEREEGDCDTRPLFEIKVTPDTLAGCGLKVQEAPEPEEGEEPECDKLAVDPQAIAGCGLKQQDADSEEDCDKLAVDIDAIKGCNLKTVPGETSEDCDTLAVDVPSLAGCHLEVDTEDGCDYLYVDLATTVNGDSGIEVVEQADDCPKYRLKLDCHHGLNDDGEVQHILPNMLGNGLEEYGPNSCPKIQVKEGCYIDVTESGVAVDIASLVDDDGGLRVAPGDGECEDKLAVNHGCTLRLNDAGELVVYTEVLVGGGLVVEAGTEESAGCDKIAFPLTPETGPGFSAVTAVTLDGCGLKYTVTAFTFQQNRDGVLLGFEAGDSTTQSVDLSGLSTCINGSNPCYSWNCEDGECVQVCDTSGAFATLSECEQALSYDCVDGECLPGCEGEGEFASVEECEEDCGEAEESYDCEGGECVDPGDGSGEYSTLEDCEAACDGSSSSSSSGGGGSSSSGEGTDICGCDVPEYLCVTIHDVVIHGAATAYDLNNWEGVSFRVKKDPTVIAYHEWKVDSSVPAFCGLSGFRLANSRIYNCVWEVLGFGSNTGVSNVSCDPTFQITASPQLTDYGNCLPCSCWGSYKIDVTPWTEDCGDVPLTTYNCVDGTCTDPGDGSGTYSTLSACEDACEDGGDGGGPAGFGCATYSTSGSGGMTYVGFDGDYVYEWFDGGSWYLYGYDYGYTGDPSTFYWILSGPSAGWSVSGWDATGCATFSLLGGEPGSAAEMTVCCGE